MEELRPEVGAVSPDLVKVGDRGSNSGFSNPSLLSLILDLAFFLGRERVTLFLAPGSHDNQCSTLSPHLTLSTICKQASVFCC